MKDSTGTRPVDCVRLTEEMHKKESIDATKKEVQRQNSVLYAKKVPDKSNNGYEKSPDGSVERWYGPDGKPVKDKHNTNHGNSKKHPDVPHGHDWGEDENGNWSPGPGYPWPNEITADRELLNGTIAVVGGAATAYGIYVGVKWIVAVVFAGPTGGASIGAALLMP